MSSYTSKCNVTVNYTMFVVNIFLDLVDSVVILQWRLDRKETDKIYAKQYTV